MTCVPCLYPLRGCLRVLLAMDLEEQVTTCSSSLPLAWTPQGAFNYEPSKQVMTYYFSLPPAWSPEGPFSNGLKKAGNVMCSFCLPHA